MMELVVLGNPPYSHRRSNAPRKGKAQPKGAKRARKQTKKKAQAKKRSAASAPKTKAKTMAKKTQPRGADGKFLKKSAARKKTASKKKTAKKRPARKKAASKKRPATKKRAAAKKPARKKAARKKTASKTRTRPRRSKTFRSMTKSQRKTYRRGVAARRAGFRQSARKTKSGKISRTTTVRHRGVKVRLNPPGRGFKAALKALVRPDTLKGTAVSGIGFGGALAIPAMVAQRFPRYAYLNRGSYGVALSAVSSAALYALAGMAKVRRENAQRLYEGAVLATLIKGLHLVVPRQYLRQILPLEELQPMAALPAPASAPAPRGQAGYMTTNAMLRGERSRGVNGWLTMPQSGMNGWLAMGNAQQSLPQFQPEALQLQESAF